jgi:hypothetical protein
LFRLFIEPFIVSAAMGMIPFSLIGVVILTEFCLVSDAESVGAADRSKVSTPAADPSLWLYSGSWKKNVDPWPSPADLNPINPYGRQQKMRDK